MSTEYTECPLCKGTGYEYPTMLSKLPFTCRGVSFDYNHICTKCHGERLVKKDEL